jgi:lysophospholipase L1-like esterase
MDKTNLRLLAIGLVILFVLSGITAYIILTNENNKPSKEKIRVACVGDSLTQSTAYPYDLWKQLDMDNYTLSNFGAGSTTVSLKSETPYMNTSVFQNALGFQPNIVIIMLGTNDAQPSLFQFNASFVGDYVKLVDAFQTLASNPKIWVVLPPPIFSNQTEKISGQYFASTIIPDIKQAANQTKVPTIDVFSALDSPSYFQADGEHLNSAGAQLTADVIYEAMISRGS